MNNQYIKKNRNVFALLLLVSFLLPVVWYLVTRGFSYREGLVLLFLVAGGWILMSRRNGLRNGFLFWIILMGIGYRTTQITTFLRIHPLEVSLWGLLFLSMSMRKRNGSENAQLWLPPWLWLFLPFLFWGWIPGLNAGRPWDLMFSEFKNFLILIPLFPLLETILQDWHNWRPILLVFFATGTWIAGMGLLEYFFPGIQTLFPGFISNPIASDVGGGFLRATFSFWGSSVATFICVLTLPLGLSILHWWQKPIHRVIISLSAAIQVAGIYIGGYRSMWAMLALQILIWILVRYGFLLGGIFTLLASLVYRFLPYSTQDRAFSLMLALNGNPIDSSSIDRTNRLSTALQGAVANPLGVGWAGSGWVHSDFAQVAANLGVFAGFVFLGAYLLTLWRLWRQFRKVPDPINFPLLLSFLACSSMLIGEGVTVLPQLAIPVWFIWVLVELQLRSIQTGKGKQ